MGLCVFQRATMLFFVSGCMEPLKTSLHDFRIQIKAAGMLQECNTTAMPNDSTSKMGLFVVVVDCPRKFEGPAGTSHVFAFPSKAVGF